MSYNFNTFGGGFGSSMFGNMFDNIKLPTAAPDPIQQAAASDPIAIVSAPTSVKASTPVESVSAVDDYYSSLASSFDESDFNAFDTAPVQPIVAPTPVVAPVQPIVAPTPIVAPVQPVTAPVQPVNNIPPVQPIINLPDDFNAFAGMAPINSSANMVGAFDGLLTPARVGGSAYNPGNDDPWRGMSTATSWDTTSDMSEWWEQARVQGTVWDSFKATQDMPTSLGVANRAQIAETNKYLGSEAFLKDIKSWEVFNDEAMGDYAGLESGESSFVNRAGVPSTIKIPSKWGGVDTYGYNARTHQVELQHEQPDPTEKNMFNSIAIAGAIAVTGGAAGAAMAGMGSLAPAVTNAIGQAVVNGAATAIQGGDLSDVLTSATLAGAGKYATGLSEAAEAATAADTMGGLGDISGFNDTLGSMGTVSAETASLAAKAEIANRVVSGLQGIQAIDEGNVLGGVAGVAGASGMFSGDTLSKIETGADTIKAVEDKDILGAVSGGLKLADLKAPQEYAEDYLTKEFEENDWVMNNVAPMSKASLGFVDDLTKGDSMEDAITSAFATYAKSGGGLSQLFPDGLDTEIGSFEIPMDFLDPLLELGRQIDKNILQPVKDDVTTVVRKTGQAIRDAAPDVDLPDVDMSGFELPSFDLDIDLPSLNLPSISFADLDLDFSGFDMPSLSMPDIDIDMPSVSLPDFPDFNFPKWESSPDSSDSSEGLDIEAPEVGFDFNASAGREAERTANAERTKAEDFERLDISNYFSNPLLR